MNCDFCQKKVFISFVLGTEEIQGWIRVETEVGIKTACPECWNKAIKIWKETNNVRTL